MTTSSDITPEEIDSEYPIAGVDNDSQGFRDNFNTIKNSISAAKAAIIALETTTAQGITYNSDSGTNDFNGNILQDADFRSNTEFIYSTGNITSSQNISFLNGNYQLVQVGADVTLTFSDWPDIGRMAHLRLQITSDGSSRTINWNVAESGSFISHNDWPETFIVTSETEPVIVDFWTTNGGITVFRQSQGTFS